jgi:hypothetical protein
VPVQKEVFPRQVQVHCRLPKPRQLEETQTDLLAGEPEADCLFLEDLGVTVQEECGELVDEEGRFLEVRVVLGGVGQSCIANRLPTSLPTLTCVPHPIPILFAAMRYRSRRVAASCPSKNTPPRLPTTVTAKSFLVDFFPWGGSIYYFMVTFGSRMHNIIGAKR